MKNKIKKVVSLLILFLMSTLLIYTDVPTGINYQGRYEESGTPVTGTRTFRFKIYDAPTGGTLLWDSGDVSLEVVNGLFNYVLECSHIDWRNVTPYLEVSVNGTILSPREKIQASPYAFYSSSASYAYTSAVAEDANKLGGQSPSYYLDTSATAQTKSGNLTVNQLTANKLILNSSTVTVNGVEMFFVPRGAIIMWSGSAANIPPGWALCDGTNGTPDLRDKFIIAAGGTYSPGATGGTTSHTHTVDIAAFNSASAGAHTHSIDPPATNTTSAGSHTHGGGTLEFSRVVSVVSGTSYSDYYINLTAGSSSQRLKPYAWAGATSSDGSHTHSVDIGAFNSSSAGDHTHTIDPPATTSSSASHLPPYYALCFIMKL